MEVYNTVLEMSFVGIFLWFSGLLITNYLIDRMFPSKRSSFCRDGINQIRSTKRKGIFKSVLVVVLEKIVLVLPAILGGRMLHTGIFSLAILFVSSLLIIWTRREETVIIVDIGVLIVDFIIGVFFGLGSAITAHVLLVFLTPFLGRLVLRKMC